MDHNIEFSCGRAHAPRILKEDQDAVLIFIKSRGLRLTFYTGVMQSSASDETLCSAASIEGIMPPQFHFLPLLFGDQDLTRLGAFKRADDAAFLDLIDDARGA